MVIEFLAGVLIGFVVGIIVVFGIIFYAFSQWDGR